MSGTAMIPSQCINLSVHYFRHPKVERLVGLLGRGAEVLPIRLWCHCGEHHAEEGRLTEHTEQEIESACKWWGEKGAMVRAFLKLKLMERDGRDFIVHDWTEWQGHIHHLKVRAKKNAQIRWEKLAAAGSNGRADSNAVSTASSNALSGLDCADTPKAPRKRGAGLSRSAARKEEARAHWAARAAAGGES